MRRIFTVLLILVSSGVFAATPGDDCSDAILVSSSGCSAAGAYNNTGITGTLTPPACFTTGTNNGMWFSFVASSVNVTVTVTGTTLTTPQIALLSPPVTGCAAGGTFTVLACSSPGTATATVVSNGGLTVGNTYYIYVDGQNATVGTFQVCLSSPQPPTNDAPCNAITPPSITNWCSPTGAYTSLGSTPDVNPSCFNPAYPNTVWFKFTATQIGCTITINGGTGGIQPQVAIMTLTGSCTTGTFTQSGCAIAAAGQTSVTLTDNFLVPGTTYYVAVAGAGGVDGSFQICINNYVVVGTISNDQCTGAIPLCPGQRYYGTTAGATSTNDIPIGDWQCNGDLDNAVWYSFVATTPPQNVVFNVNWTDRLGDGDMQFEMFKYTGTGAPCAHDNNAGDWTSLLTNIAQLPCDEATAGPGTETVPASQLVAGQTYYVLIDNFPDDTLDFNFVGTGIAGTSAGNDTTICVNSSAFNIPGASPAGGTWSGPGITNAASGTFDPTGLNAGTYTVYYSANTCIAAKEITLVGPKVTTSADVTICQGQSTTLDGNIVEYPGSAPVSFTNSTAYTVAGGGSGSSIINVAGINPNTVGTNPILSVCIDVGAEYADDDKITLKCPGGTTITLVPYNNSGGTFLSGFSGTCFTLGSPAIGTGTPPYSGSYSPSQAFTLLNGCAVDGAWTLKVTNNFDEFDADGEIADWTITFENTIPNPTFVWAPTTNMTGATTLDPTVTPPAGVNSYILTATDTFGCKGSDTVTVTVNARPNAGADQTISCITTFPGGVATMAGSGTGTWTSLTGNPGTSTITTPTSPTTTITAFSTTGTYAYQLGPIGCADTADVIVTTKPNAGPDQVLACTTLPGGSVTMAATGAGTWTAQAGNPGTATITTPASPTTTITTFSVAGTYYFIWTVGGCTDTAKVTVASQPNAGPDQTVSCGGSATMAATGAGTWTALVSNPGTATITTPTSPTTTVTNFSVAGTYSFQWGTGPCLDTVKITITAKPNAGPDQGVSCYPINTTATMAATGTGTWTAMAGNPGTATITTPASPTTTITAFSAAGTYNFIWTNGGCSDTAAVVVSAKPNAGPDQTVTCAVLPGGSATMAGTGVGTWTPMGTNPGTATITTTTSPTTTITTFSTAGTYNFIWANGGCSDTAAIVVTAKPNAGTDQTVTCAVLPGGTATMTGTGTGTWTAMAGNPGTATITTTTSPTTTITTFSAAGTYNFIWTNGTCTDTAAIVVTAKPNAGPDQAVSCYPINTTATMAATGTGTWTAMAGNPGTAVITNATSPTTTITTFSAAGTYNFIWTSGACTDTASVIVSTKPNAGPDQTVSCTLIPGGSATMAALGAGTWTAMAGNPGTATITNAASPTTTITNYSAAGTYSFIWTVSTCTDTANVIVTAKPNAGPDQTTTCNVLPGGSVTMAATGAGTWTAQAGNPGTSTITTTGSPTTTITTFSVAGTYHFIWTSAGCTDTAAVVVTAKPNAGPDQTVSCAALPGGSTSMTATGTGTWTTMAGNPGTAVITSSTSPTTTITTFSAAGSYSFIWTNGSGCADTALVTVTASPDAGPDQTVTCAILPGGTATMAATGAGTWTAQAGNPGTSTITSTTSPVTTITTFSAAGTYNFIWTSSGCSDTAAIVVTAIPDAGPAQTVNCINTPGGTATMAATGAGTWTPSVTNTGTATITAPVSPTTTITTFSTAGTYYFVWTNADGCTDSTTVTVTANPDAGPDQTVSCAILPGGTATMAATGAGTWTDPGTNPGTATITTPASPTTTITTFSTSGTYSFIWTNASNCSDTANVIVTAKPDAGPDQNICQYTTATMAAAGTGTWTAVAGNPSVAAITTPSSPTTTITALNAPGPYNFVWTNASNCSDTVTILVSTQPQITVANTGVCAGTGTTLIPIAAPAGGTYVWSTTETTNTIMVSPVTTTPYSVTYTVGICSASTTATVSVNQLPVVTVGTVASVCTASNGLAIALVSLGTPAYSYTWSNPGGTNDTLSGLAAGNYSVTVTDINSCTATASGTVSLQTPAVTVNEVSQHDLKCFNDGTGDIYINTTDTARQPTSYTISYLWSNTPPAVTQNLTGVQAGSYTVTVTDQFGCTGTASYVLTQPLALTLTPADTNPHCFGYSNGTAAVTPAGGSGNYYYVWNTNPVQNNSEATNLTSGSYTVSVTDDSLCFATQTFTLTDPQAIAFSDSVIVDPSCFGENNGSAQVTPENGMANYSFVWSTNPAQMTNPATGLTAGKYSVTVTDARGCTAITSVTLLQPTAVTLTVTPTAVSCFGFNDGSTLAVAGGGTPAFTYVWNNLETTANDITLVAGTYTVTATDSKGCTISGSATVIQPSPVTDALTAVRTNCPNSTDGSITAVASGGVGNYSYTLETFGGGILQSGNTSGSFTALGYGTYLIVAEDQNSCPFSDTISVPRAPFDVYTDSSTSTSCYGSQYKDGTIFVQGFTIPNGPFQFSVDGSPLQYSPNFYNLSSGQHTITAQDSYGCDTTFSITVAEPLPAVLQILPGDSTITAGTSLQLSPVFGPYSTDSIKGYSWSPGTGMNCIDCPSPIVSPYGNQTTYTLMVTYNQGCVASASVEIDVNGAPPVYVPNAFSPNGDNVNDTWLVYGTGIKDFKAMIFDRWGEKVFESDDQAIGWDGTYKGQLEQSGVFVYIVNIVYLSGETTTKQGSVTLIR